LLARKKDRQAIATVYLTFGVSWELEVSKLLQLYGSAGGTTISKSEKFDTSRYRISNPLIDAGCSTSTC